MVAHEFVESLRKHMARAVSLLCWPLRGHGRPLSPNPSPTRGEGSTSDPPNTFIHTRVLALAQSESDEMLPLPRADRVAGNDFRRACWVVASLSSAGDPPCEDFSMSFSTRRRHGSDQPVPAGVGTSRTCQR